jgi:hypothetical protein
VRAAGGSFIVAMFVALADAGCRSDQNPGLEPRPVTDKEWRTVIADWYEDGDFDQSHRCDAVLAAHRHLPSRSPETQTLHDDIRALEETTC